jgi:2-polyprenyl-3-methyl-5-hydroxy-6-metoxy-1,4-benzoquinol methylase
MGRLVADADKRDWDELTAEYGVQLMEGLLLAGFSSLLPPGGDVLDIGCGAGVPVARFLVRAGFKVTGVDVSSSMLELARVHVPEANFVKMDMRQLEFDADCFDGICAFYSLFHVPREEHLLGRATQRLLISRVNGSQRFDGCTVCIVVYSVVRHHNRLDGLSPTQASGPF